MGVRRIAAGMACVGALVVAPAFAEWPQWRGPAQRGSSAETGLPLRWSASEGIAWKLELPEISGSTPIVHGERVYLNVARGDALELWAVDRNTGKPLWQAPVGTGNVSTRKQNMSSPSPVTDGRHVAVLTGTGVLKGFDLAGKELWARDFQKEHGKFGLMWGYASSPLLHDGSLYVQVLHGMHTDDPSYVTRIELATGKTVWRVERPTDAPKESPDAYTTPAIAHTKAGLELIISGADYVTGHDLATGKELWRAAGLNPAREGFYRVVASPVVLGDLVIAPTRVRPMLALRAGGRGDVTTSHKAWSHDAGPDVPTPASDGEILYVVNDKGIASALDAKTGAVLYADQRLKVGTYSASPVVADGKVYATSEDGVTTVYRAGPKFELLAENTLPGFTLGSIAVSEGQLFLRAGTALHAIGERRRR